MHSDDYYHRIDLPTVHLISAPLLQTHRYRARLLGELQLGLFTLRDENSEGVTFFELVHPVHVSPLFTDVQRAWDYFLLFGKYFQDLALKKTNSSSDSKFKHFFGAVQCVDVVTSAGR
jgi:hypothetical protein